MTKQPEQITALLIRLQEGDQDAVESLFPLVYEHLRNIARNQLKGERADHTLNATALVHESYLKLINVSELTWQNRAHFLSVAATAMRRILIDYARARIADKRGGGQAMITLNDEIHGQMDNPEQFIALDEALTALKALDERQFKIVEFRYFGGLSQEEIAEVLKISVATVGREWRMARAWLSKQLGQ